jgi:hypothetical protein
MYQILILIGSLFIITPRRTLQTHQSDARATLCGAWHILEFTNWPPKVHGLPVDAFLGLILGNEGGSSGERVIGQGTALRLPCHRVHEKTPPGKAGHCNPSSTQVSVRIDLLSLRMKLSGEAYVPKVLGSRFS